MRSVPISVEFDHLQIEREQRSLFPEPMSGRLPAGVLNILVGPNGSGKTSLLDLVALRARTPLGTRLIWAGCTDATDIAYLPQQLWDVLDVRVGDLVELAFGRHRSRSTEVPGLLEEVMARPKKELGTLSGGQRQLLLFWLVSSRPQGIYIYDEPLRHLDDRAARYVIETIENQVKEGMFVAISEHSVVEHWTVPYQRLLVGAELATTRGQNHVE